MLQRFFCWADFTHRTLWHFRAACLARRLNSGSHPKSLVKFALSISKAKMKNILLPIAAVMLALFGISYSACQESKADTKSAGTASKIRQEIVQFEQMYNELKKVQETNVAAYSEEMGVTSNSTALEQISKQNEIMETLRLRLEYHRLQLIQADTTNETRNELQLKEISEDIVKLKVDGEIIRSGFGGNVNTRVTK